MENRVRDMKVNNLSVPFFVALFLAALYAK